MSGERGVLRCLQLRRDRYFVTRGIDRDQRAVVERVQVGAQQESVSHVVGFGAQVAADVRGFEDCFDRAVRKRATALVCFEELLPERGLALPYDDRGECLLAASSRFDGSNARLRFGLRLGFRFGFECRLSECLARAPQHKTRRQCAVMRDIVKRALILESSARISYFFVR